MESSILLKEVIKRQLEAFENEFRVGTRDLLWSKGEAAIPLARVNGYQ